MVEFGVVDRVLRYARRDHDGRDPRAEPIESEAVVNVLGLAHTVAGGNGGARRYVVVETAVLVPRDDEHARLPQLRVPDGLVGLLDQLFATGDVVERVLRRSAGVVLAGARQDVAVVRLDENVRRCGSALCEACDEVREVGEAVPNHRVERHAGERERRGCLVALHNLPVDACFVEQLEHSAVVEPETIEDRVPTDLETGRAVIEPAGRRGVGEEPVRKRRSGQRRVPRIAQGELAGERVEDRQLTRRIAVHDAARRGDSAFGVVDDEPTVREVRWVARPDSPSSASGPASCARMLANSWPGSLTAAEIANAAGVLASAGFIGSFGSGLENVPLVRSRALVCAPVTVSRPVIAEKPSMWSNDRFSSMRTKMWSIVVLRRRDRPNRERIPSRIALSAEMRIDQKPQPTTVTQPHPTQTARTTYVHATHTHFTTQYQPRHTQDETQTHASHTHEHGRQSQQSLWRSSSQSLHAS